MEKWKGIYVIFLFIKARVSGHFYLVIEPVVEGRVWVDSLFRNATISYVITAYHHGVN